MKNTITARVDDHALRELSELQEKFSRTHDETVELSIRFMRWFIRQPHSQMMIRTYFEDLTEAEYAEEIMDQVMEWG